MIHISDVCTAYESAFQLFKIDPTIKNIVYGVRTGQTYTLKEAISLLEIVMGKEIRVEFGGKPYKTREVMLPCQTYQYLPNWKALINLQEGFGRFK